MDSTDTMTADEAQIRRLIDGWAEALRAKDIDGIVSRLAPDVLLYDLFPPLAYRGVEAYRALLEQIFPQCAGPMIYEEHDLRITASGDVAFSTSLTRCGGAGADGKVTTMWTRHTVCYGKRNGKWLVVHEHMSVPSYMDGSNKAAMDLTP